MTAAVRAIPTGRAAGLRPQPAAPFSRSSIPIAFEPAPAPLNRIIMHSTGYSIVTRDGIKPYEPKP